MTIFSLKRGDGKLFSAFTLIELLVVVGVIAILAAIAIPNMLEAQLRSKVARVKSDMRTLATALEAYRVDNNNFPPEGYPGIAPVWDSGISLIRLTTPVAYLSSLSGLTDPFITDPAAYTPPTRNFLYVDYRNFAWLHPGEANLSFSSLEPELAGFTLQQASRGETSFDGWGSSSVGPDGRSSTVLAGPFDLISVGNESGFQPETTYLARVYDPTNGLTSNGDIARFGGQVPPGLLR